jgi:hypothetical protein
MTQEEILEIAYENSYKVIILNYDWEQIMDEEDPYFIHNPARLVPHKDRLEALLIYYEFKEDYIKCQAVHNYITKKS